MDLTGKTIDRYKILEQLGQGGMAVVYKAFDTRLERDVALKVIRMGEIPQSQRTQLLKRFEREAKSQARFYHAHIVQVFDYGEHEGAPYLVMAYLPGGSLKDRAGQPMPYTEAAALLAPIADALAYAHEMDVLHRDVKPNNILFDAKGEPALADFGIAKVLGDVDEATLTGTGMGIGTPQYMAPEQWEGKPEKATDIYALGVVFYELVTGRKPYDADTPGALIRQQATEMHPSPREIIPGLPHSAVQAMDTALAKDPTKRYPSMAAFAQALHNLAAGASQPLTTSVLGETTIVEQTPPPVEVQPTYYPQEEPTESTPLPITDESKEKADFGIPASSKPGIHLPDWVWGLASLVIIAGIVLAVMLSRKGAEWLAAAATETPTETEAFLATATNTELPTSTNLPTQTATLTPSPTPIMARVNTNLGVVVRDEPNGNSLVVSRIANGGLVELQGEEQVDNFGNLWLLVLNLEDNVIGWVQAGLMVTATPQLNSQSAAFTNTPAPTPFGGGTGTIVFSSSLSGNYEIWRMEVSSGNLDQLTFNEAEDHSPVFSPDGSRIVFISDRSTYSDIWRVNADGSNLVQLTNKGNNWSPAFSPDGDQIVFSSYTNHHYDIWLMNADGSNLNQLTNNIAYDSHPVFSPNGSQIIFVSDRSGNYDIWRMDADGSNLIQLTNDKADDNNPVFSPDGSQIIFYSDRSGNDDIWLMDADGSNLVQLTDNPTHDYNPAFSPDGSQIVFTSIRSGHEDIWLMDASGNNLIQLTVDMRDNDEPVWQPAVSTP